MRSQVVRIALVICASLVFGALIASVLERIVQ